MDDLPEPNAPAPDDEITPDTKDWTWVLERPCPECGFVAASSEPDEIGAAVRALTPRWQAALARDDARVRPRPGVWSTLEYGAHVRDVHRVFTVRLRAMLTEDYPTFANWDQDAEARAQDYASQDPQTVATELAQAASVLADLFDAVTEAELGRTGERSNGSVFTVRTLGQYYLHDVVHHVHDVGA